VGEYAGLVGEYAGLVGEYAGLVGEYAGLVGEYAGLVGEYAGLVGEYAGLVGEYAGLVGEYAGLVGEYAGLVGEYAGLVGEYAGLVGEYAGLVGLAAPLIAGLELLYAGLLLQSGAGLALIPGLCEPYATLLPSFDSGAISGENCANPSISGDKLLRSACGDINPSAPLLASCSGLAAPVQSPNKSSASSITSSGALLDVNVGLISNILSSNNISNKPVPMGHICPISTLLLTPKN